MTDTKRKPNQPNRGQQQGSQSSQNPERRQTPESQRTQGNPRDNESWRENETGRTKPEDRDRNTREPSSIAPDRGRDSERRNFSSDREADELGSELERETGIETDDEEDIDRPGRSNR